MLFNFAVECPPPQQNARIDCSLGTLGKIDVIRKSTRLGFTLAEVLITLGIIGVVAALTIPSLIAKHKKKVFATRVKTTYNIVSNALVSSVQENGAPNTWDYGDSIENNGDNTLNSIDHIEKMVNKYFLPYFKAASSGRYTSGRYLSQYYIILANGTSLTFMTDGTTSNNTYTPHTMYIVANFKGQVFGDLLASNRNYSRNDVVMYVNINTNYAKLKLFTWDGPGKTRRENIITNTTYGCNKSIAANRRLNCGALIQHDNWEIKDDFPW